MADYAKLSDDELLAATRGDPEAFGALYERHARGVLAYLARATGDRELALDLTAEVFAAALVASDRYRTGEAPAGSWLFGIARNKLAETRRRNARADAARRKLGIPALSFTDQALDRVDEVLDAERVGYLESLGELTPDEREAVTARVIDERDYADVARAAGVSQAAMRQRVSRGLARLAEMRNRAT